MLLAAGLTSSHAQDTWTQKADFGGEEGRFRAVGFSIGSKGYVGSGETSDLNVKKDFWEYDPAINAWTQKADFGGTGRSSAVGFSIGSKGYMGTGYGDTYLKDFWEYDPATNAWTRKADFGGAARDVAVGFSIGSKGYIGTGYDSTGSPRMDFWEYDPATNTWTQKADFGGLQRLRAVGFSIGSKGYIGTGGDIFFVVQKDFWEYDPATNAWTQKADFGGGARSDAVGFSIASKGYIGAGVDSRQQPWAYLKDFGEYIPGEHTSGGCTPPPVGLVSWWSGDRTADDVQGTNNGTLLNGASFKRGIVGPGFLFDGINDGVTVPNSASLSPERITVAAWVYITGNQNFFRHIISKDNASAGIREWGLSVDLQTFVPFVGLNTGFFVVGGATVAQLNTWYHVVMTHDGATLRLYVNGVLDGSVAAVGDIVPTSNPVGIGLNQSVSPFKGIIDEAQIFDRALTDADILAIYQAGADGQCKPDIFVASIDPSYEVVRRGFLISTSIVIQDENGIGIEDASAQIKTILPSGSILNFPATTDATGQATISFGTQDSGLYKFKVQRVTHPTREYNPSLNIETTDRLLIP